MNWKINNHINITIKLKDKYLLKNNRLYKKNKRFILIKL